MTDWNAPATGGGFAQPTPQPAPVADGAVEVVATPEVQLTVQEKNDLIRQWLGRKDLATVAVDAEKALREKLTGVLFPTPKKGTQRYVSPEGFGSIKLVHGWNHKLGDKDKIGEDGLAVPIKDQVDNLLTRIEGLGERGVLLADRLVKWRPELVVAEYELLAASNEDADAQAKAMIDEILTVTAASPQLSFEPPKEKK